MIIRDELEALKVKSLRRIGEAAKQGDTGLIVRVTNIVQEVDRLMKAYEQLVNEVGNLTINYEALEDINLSEVSTSSDAQFSPRKKARLQKEAFINELQELGITLRMSRDSLLLTDDGQQVGIAYSTEHLPNRWWLGIKDDDYKAVVLICQNGSGRNINLILSKDFWSNHVESLTKNSKGRTMIHIIYHKGSYNLVEGNGEYVPLDSFVEAYDLIMGSSK